MGAELALPNLVAIALCQNAKLVEDCATLLADLCVSCSNLTLVGQAVQLDFEHVGVKLLSVDICLLLSHCTLLGSEITSKGALICAVFVIAQIEIAAKIIRVHLFA